MLQTISSLSQKAQLQLLQQPPTNYHNDLDTSLNPFCNPHDNDINISADAYNVTDQTLANQLAFSSESTTLDNEASSTNQQSHTLAINTNIERKLTGNVSESMKNNIIRNIGNNSSFRSNNSRNQAVVVLNMANNNNNDCTDNKNVWFSETHV